MSTEVLKSTKQHADNLQRKSCRPMTSNNLPWFGLTAQLYLKFLLITQHEVPFKNTSEATERSSNRTENGTSCDSVTNRRSRVGLQLQFITRTTATITRRQICFDDPAYLRT